MKYDQLDLPIPGVDPMPPPVEMSDEQVAKAKVAKATKRALLNVKTDTESRVKYVLERLFGADLRKDGDWATLPGGSHVWQRKVSDFSGGVLLWGSSTRSSVYVEVKGCSPGTDFSLARLDRPSRKGIPSQHARLTEKHEDGYLVWLAIGWWYAKDRTYPIVESRGTKVYTKWRKEDVLLSIDVIPWAKWLGTVLPMVAEEPPRRAFRWQDRFSVANCGIDKVGRRWKLAPNHWWNFLDAEEILQERLSASEQKL